MDLLALVEAVDALLRVLLRVDGSPRLGGFLQLEVLALDKLILHRQLVLLSGAPVHTEILYGVLDVLGLLEAVGCGDFVIKVDLFLVEDKDVAAGHYIS